VTSAGHLSFSLLMCYSTPSFMVESAVPVVAVTTVEASLLLRRLEPVRLSTPRVVNTAELSLRLGSLAEVVG